MLVSELLESSNFVSLHPLSQSHDAEISSITLDSRAVEPGALFIAIKGNASDGHDYIPQAIEAGATAILCQEFPKDAPENIVFLKSPDVRRGASQLAHIFYDYPSESLAVLGVTGTNGKTTTTFLIDSLMRAKFGKNGLLGTVWNDEGNGARKAELTTPDAISLHRSLANMVNNRCLGVALELSSHGIDQGRTADLTINTAVFTNLTQDHLDYHGTMENYYQAKKQLFIQLGQQDPQTKPCAIINIDDTYGKRLSLELKDEFPQLRQITFGFSVDADLRAKDIKQTGKGAEFRLDYNKKSYLVQTPMIGLFNIRNILAALASVTAPKLLNMREAIAAIQTAKQVPGRLERVSQSIQLHAFVDYAHTPDALENVCQTLQELEPTRLITVFGCGGDRDATKRPLMAEAASRRSTFCIVTSDNPRTENPISIIKEVESGLIGDHHLSIVDRAKAIQTAVDLARNGDVILIAGKGHEDYQIFGTEKVHFNDRKHLRDALQKKEAELQEALQKKSAPRNDYSD